MTPMVPPPSSPSSSTVGDGARAGYGRSCTNCSRAKCKCILRPASSVCERCHRLGKDCQPIAATRKRMQRRNMPSRTAQLEEKLDDLVSILRSSQGAAGGQQQQQQQQQQQSPHQHQQQPSLGGPQLTPSSHTPASQAQPSPISRLESLATAASASEPRNSLTSLPGNLNANYDESDENSEPTPSEAELYLQKFRSWLRNFPFVVIPPTTSAAALREERPFFWLCIMCITSMSVRQMENLKERVRREIAEKMIIRHEPSMDLLLGLIAHLSWANLNLGPNWKPFLALFSQLALAVAYELGLTRSFAEDQYFATSFRAWGPRQAQPRKRTTEERRAVLALWFLTSSISSFLGKVDAMRWTPHMEESLEYLEKEKEDVHDGTLTGLIRLQLVIHEVLLHVVEDVTKNGSESATPSYVYRRSLLIQLKTARDNMSDVALSSYIVRAHSHAAEIHVQSMGISRSTMPPTQRVDMLYSCLQAARSWFDIWFSIPLPDMPGLPFGFYIQLNHAQVSLYRLNTLEDPLWDREELLNSGELLAILDRTIERFETMDVAYPLKSPDPGWVLYGKAAKIIRNVKTNWEPTLTQNPNSRLSTTTGQGDYSGAQVPGSGGAGHSGSPITNGPVAMGADVSMGNGVTPGIVDPQAPFLDSHDVDFTDLSWMTDVFVPWEL